MQLFFAIACIIFYFICKGLYAAIQGIVEAIKIGKHYRKLQAAKENSPSFQHYLEKDYKMKKLFDDPDKCWLYFSIRDDEIIYDEWLGRKYMYKICKNEFEIEEEKKNPHYRMRY